MTRARRDYLAAAVVALAGGLLAGVPVRLAGCPLP
jgi:hypothetical protein